MSEYPVARELLPRWRPDRRVLETARTNLALVKAGAWEADKAIAYPITEPD